MPKRLNPKRIHQACLLHFKGETLTDIAQTLEVNPATLSRWRTTEIWQNYEAKLLDEWHEETKANENAAPLIVFLCCILCQL